MSPARSTSRGVGITVSAPPSAAPSRVIASTCTPARTRRLSCPSERPTAGELSSRRTAIIPGKPGSIVCASTSDSSALCTSCPPASRLCFDSISTISSVPARTWPCRFVTLVHTLYPSAATTTSSTTRPALYGKNGCEMATSGSPTTRLKASSSATVNTRRGAEPRSSLPSLRAGTTTSARIRASAAARRSTPNRKIPAISTVTAIQVPSTSITDSEKRLLIISTTRHCTNREPASTASSSVASSSSSRIVLRIVAHVETAGGIDRSCSIQPS